MSLARSLDTTDRSPWIGLLASLRRLVAHSRRALEATALVAAGLALVAAFILLAGIMVPLAVVALVAAAAWRPATGTGAVAST